MRRTAFLAALGIALAVASPAWAKGPASGTIEGEGLEQEIVIGYGEGTPGGDRLVEDVGFFHAAFGQVPDPMLEEAPTRDLGPVFTIRWDVPGPNNDEDVIVQQVYPYAAGGPLVYTEPGQQFFTTERTRGGWYRAPERLVGALQAIGIPEPSALDAAAGGTRWAPIGASLGAVVLLGAGPALVVRRRGNVVPAAT